MSIVKVYSIQNDILSHEANIEKLDLEIKNSESVLNFNGLNIAGDLIEVIGEAIINEVILDGVLYNHEAKSLEDIKNIRYSEIDSKTADLITAGFSFGGHIFSMSLTAQINWSNFPNLPDQLFPLNVVDASEEVYVLSLANKLNFYFSALNHKNQYLQSGGILKAQVKACETIEAVNLIIDNR